MGMIICGTGLIRVNKETKPRIFLFDYKTKPENSFPVSFLHSKYLIFCNTPLLCALTRGLDLTHLLCLITNCFESLHAKKSSYPPALTVRANCKTALKYTLRRRVVFADFYSVDENLLLRLRFVAQAGCVLSPCSSFFSL